MPLEAVALIWKVLPFFRVFAVLFSLIFRGAFFTFTVTDAFLPLEVSAVTLAVPVAFAVRTPLEDTCTTFGLLDFQVTFWEAFLGETVAFKVTFSFLPTVMDDFTFKATFVGFITVLPAFTVTVNFLEPFAVL